ncbi:hypothetical protein EAF04_000840 [Stromatinia cepivora]|nr:hypothetical protein EAF04_000840 [Stromatinia cepivora]
MKRISPQLINNTYQNIKPLASLTGAARSMEIPKMLSQRSIIARRFFNSPSNKGRSSQQRYSRNYSKPSFIPDEQKPTSPDPTRTSAVTPEPQKLKDNSHITTHSHAYYETYSIAGFDPSVYTLLPQPKPAKKFPDADLKAKKTAAEYTCDITTYNYAYYKEFSISGFKPINHAPTPEEVTGKGSTAKIESQEEDDVVDPYDSEYFRNFSIAGFHPSMYTLSQKSNPTKKPSTVDVNGKEMVVEHICSITTYSHAYYKEFSIAGINPIRTTAPAKPGRANEPVTEPANGPTSEPTNEPTSTAPEISRAKALAIAAAYIPSVSVQKTNKNQDCLDLDHDIETCTQTIEELGFETLGITGFQSTHKDTGEDELEIEVKNGKVKNGKVKNEKVENGKVEDGKVESEKIDEQPVQSREGDEGPVRAGMSVICLFMGLF